MADAKISELTALTGANVATDDELPIVDTDATATKRITAAELLNYINLGLLFTINTVTATDATYAPTATFEVLNLNHASVPIAITYAAAIPNGSVVVMHATDNGGSSHSIKLTGQTFDGTNNTATFDGADDRVAIIAMSSTRVLIIYNNSVTFSST